MQKEMKDVELQLGIVANQVHFFLIYGIVLLNSNQVTHLVKSRQEKMASADDTRHSIEDDL
jgi:hypothetical protein